MYPQFVNTPVKWLQVVLCARNLKEWEIILKKIKNDSDINLQCKEKIMKMLYDDVQKYLSERKCVIHKRLLNCIKLERNDYTITVNCNLHTILKMRKIKNVQQRCFRRARTTLKQ
jgi:hypothetical protein